MIYFYSSIMYISKAHILCVPTMSLDGLCLPENHPQPECDHMAGNNEGAEKGGEAKDDDLGPVSMRGCKGNGSSVLVVDMMDIVIPPFLVEQSVEPVAAIVFNNKVYQYLHPHLCA